jgi:hypothetical protein
VHANAPSSKRATWNAEFLEPSVAEPDSQP